MQSAHVDENAVRFGFGRAGHRPPDTMCCAQTILSGLSFSSGFLQTAQYGNQSTIGS